MKFVKFTPAQHDGDVYVRADTVTFVGTYQYGGIASAGKADTMIGTEYGGSTHVKESPSDVVSRLAEADADFVIVVDGCDRADPDLGDYKLALKEADEDAKIADERAEWYKKLAEERLTTIGLMEPDARAAIKLRDEVDLLTKSLAAELKVSASLRERLAVAEKLASERKAGPEKLAEKVATLAPEILLVTKERDQLLAKLKDTTAALEKANLELNSRRYLTPWNYDQWRPAAFSGYGNSTKPDHSTF